MKRKKTVKPKLLDVEYATTIVAAVCYQKQWHWYITPMDWWFLDYIKWGNDFIAKGYDDPDDENNSRFGLSIIDENNAVEFLKHLTPYEVDTNYLRELVTERFNLSIDWQEDKLDVMPVVCVNFDTKFLKSQFPEPSGRFEFYVPESWQGQYVEFFSDIPLDKHYWLLDGIDLFDDI